MRFATFATSLLVVCTCAATPALAGSAKLGCKPVDSQFQISNHSKTAIPSGAHVTVKITTKKKVPGVNPAMVNTSLTSNLAKELAGGAETALDGSPFAKACTASATW